MDKRAENTLRQIAEIELGCPLMEPQRWIIPTIYFLP